MTSATPTQRVRPQFTLVPPLRLRRLPGDTWQLRAASIVIAGIVPILALWTIDRLDLAAYTLAGSMVALFIHGLPYRRRAATSAGFALWVVLGCGVAMAAAAATESIAARIAIATLLAAVTKVAHDASRVGAPGAVIPVFLFTGLVFTPQEWSDVPLHVALTAASAALAWLVCMAPALVRPHGPERRTVALALDAAARLHACPADPEARADLASAISASWRALDDAGDSAVRAALEAHVLAAERVLVDATVGSAERARADARALRAGNAPVPAAPIDDDEREELRGIALDRPDGFDARHPVLAAFRPGSPSWPSFWRTVAGCALAATLSSMLGVGRPFWAITTAAVIIQPNLLLTWGRAPSRTVGAVGGVLLFALLAPVAHLDPLVAALFVLGFNALAEFFVPRNYAIGQVFVTPMALLISEFGRTQPLLPLATDRLLDTVLGVAAGLAAAFAIRNGHLRRHAHAWTERVERAAAAAERVGGSDRLGAEHARRALIDALAGLAAAVRVADGEWWSHRVDEARVVTARRRAHRALAELPGGER